MKLSGQRFSVPSSILGGNLSSAAVRVLLFLFRESNCAGRVAASYREIGTGAEITSRTTISNAIKELQKAGWFHFKAAGGPRNAVYNLRVPTARKVVEPSNVVPLPASEYVVVTIGTTEVLRVQTMKGGAMLVPVSDQ